MTQQKWKNGDRVKVVRGLWQGFVGVIDDVHGESSVARLINDDGERAYAMKDDLEAVQGQ